VLIDTESEKEYCPLEGLKQLELDLHQHIHEENNVLFPRVFQTAFAVRAQ
jgi:hypothetical protein